MKTNTTMALLTVCGALAFSTGCSQNENAAPPAAKDTQTPADTAAAPSQKAAEAQPQADAQPAAQAAQTADAAKAEAMKQQAEAAKLASDQLAQEQSRIQSLIDSAKNLTGEKKYAEALKVLGELANLKLTPEQQALVDGLKKTVEEAMAKQAAAGASQTLGDALGGKK